MSTLDIRKIRKSLKLTQSELAQRLSVHYKTIQNWEKGGTIPESKKIIIRNLDIFDKNPAHFSDNLKPGKEIVREETPLLPFSARPLEINQSHFQQFGDSYERVLSPVKGADFATVLSDDGLGPEFPDGSIVFFKHIDPELFIEWGKVHAISTKNGLIIKRLSPGSQPGSLLCSCSDPQFNPFEIPRNHPDIHFFKAIACTSIK